MKKIIDGINKGRVSIWHKWIKVEIILRITKFCNQKCIFCVTNINNKTQFWLNDIIKVIDSALQKYSWDSINFVISWWEPLLHPDLIQIIDYLYTKKCTITIQSNAVLLSNSNLIDKISKYIDKISFFISFHSSNEKIYDFITQTKWQHKMAIKWIKNVLTRWWYVYLCLNIVINRLNIIDLSNYFIFLWEEFSKINDWLELNISLMTNIEKYSYSDKILFSYSELVRKINENKKIINKYKINIHDSFGWTCDLPFCIAKDLFYYSGKPFTNYKYEKDRMRLDTCKFCKYYNNCNGFLIKYFEKYWWEEFIPLK